MGTFFEVNPELYESTFGYRDFDKQVDFLDTIFKKYHVKSILDIACGHIPHGRMLAKKGYNIVGIDVANSLLKLGKKRAREEGIKVELYNKNMIKFYIRKFEAAYIMFNSILHLISYEQLYSHFKSVNENLKKKGIYIIDLSQSAHENPFKKHKIDRIVKGIRSVINYNPKDSKNLLASFKVDTFYKKRRYSNESLVLMFLPIPLLQSLSHETGFNVVDVFSDFDFKKNFRKENQTYIAILQKR